MHIEWSESNILKNMNLGIMLGLGIYLSNVANADFVINFSDAGFTLANTFNEVSEFNFDISVDADLMAGGVYNNPALNSVDYRISGTLPNSTPSGFPGFLLIRSMSGAEFYGLSLDSGLSFSVAATADLSDGLQASELVGNPIFNFNAREFNQNPGRYHPPIFSLNSDGTGRLTNANNQSTFPNPSNGMLVDVQVGQEYIIDLTFSPASLTIVNQVPEPSSAVFLIMSCGSVLFRRRSGS